MQKTFVIQGKTFTLSGYLLEVSPEPFFEWSIDIDGKLAGRLESYLDDTDETLRKHLEMYYCKG